MQNITNIGVPPWTRSEIISHLDEFEAIYAERPIKDNQGGMKAPHMFAVWFMAKQLSPDIIVESGIWKGQSTWLLETACPDAKLFSIDLNLGYRQYISDRAIYLDKDFAEQDWSGISDRSLVFFDDHQNAYKRLQQCNWFGFKHIIFEDNYPVTQGDCYSLKKAFSNAGFEHVYSASRTLGNSIVAKAARRVVARLAGLNPIALTPQYETEKIPPNDVDSRMLKKNLDVYYEFPPVFRTSKTRWGDEWDDMTYPTPKPLIEQSGELSHKLFLDEAVFYTWICYAKLK
ncbi:hypothetical protein GCM10008090_34080 [Arenicella chitinivorans]|uniref:Uncharacterized protein n=1 Tax=Arenicella chitinivorans TaxID=1329800 RepID=A0A918S2K4_9GAMM|nr:hypothetical protein [Arenicella chitinivorans]GHA21355.1 hypothetical protein GCM10008090_34080 [Arenicella chitinivorans]